MKAKMDSVLHLALKPLNAQTRSQHLEKMAATELDLLIIGGGINGIWMALDASLRGLQVGLVEREDFGHGPSRNNSELLHGGFRYLKEWYQSPSNWLKFRSVLKLVREALREREVLMRIAPHLARAVPFCMPLFSPQGMGWAKCSFYALGFWMYDQLSGAQSIQSFSMLDKTQTLEKMTGLSSKNLAGSGIYYDCKMEPGRWVAELTQAAASAGAYVANYVEAQSPIKNPTDTTIRGFVCQDLMHSKQYQIRAKQIVDATGPWGDVFRKHVLPQAKPLLRLTKGVHLMVKQMFKEPMACAFFSDDNRIIFIVPWGENYRFSLIGTTDTDFQEDPDAVAPDEKSINYLVEKVRAIFPTCDLTPLGFYAGIRPLIRQEKGSASSVSREHTILKHDNSHLTSVFGGKWTTARVVASEALDQVFPDLKNHCRTHTLRLGGINTQELIVSGHPESSAHLRQRAQEFNFSPEILNHLIFNFGQRTEIILDLLHENPEWQKSLIKDSPFMEVEVHFALQYEMALSVSDFLIRRSLLGRLKDRGMAAAPRVAEIMGQKLQWSQEKQDREIAAYHAAMTVL